MMGDLLGEFIDYDLATTEKKRLDVVRLLISTNQLAFINQRLRLKEMGAIFEVWVVEDLAQSQGEDLEEEGDEELRGGGGASVFGDEDGRRCANQIFQC